MTAGTCVLFDHFQRRKPTAPLKAAREKLFLLSAVFSLSLAFATLSFVSDRRRLVRASESSSTAAPSRRGARPPGCRWRGRRANGRRTARPHRDIDRAPGVARGQGGQQARTLLPGSTQSGVAAAVGEHSGRPDTPAPHRGPRGPVKDSRRRPRGVHTRYLCPSSCFCKCLRFIKSRPSLVFWGFDVTRGTVTRP